MWELKQQKKDSLNIGYIDIYDDGELLKETFDLTVVPSVRYIDHAVYHMLWNDQRYSYFNAPDFFKFLEDGY